MITTTNIKNIYANIQEQLFFMIPEKWEKVYLYASIMELIDGRETGEMFFYYYPKGILKKKPINVYEIPNRFDIDENAFMKLVNKLYETIKSLRNEFKNESFKLWSNVTISIANLKFTVEYSYENLINSKYTKEDRHNIWVYKNLEKPLDSFKKEEKVKILQYLDEPIQKIDVYTESIYKRPEKKIIKYDNRYNSIPEEKSSYTYEIKTKKKSKDVEETYVEQIERQKEEVKSQILKNL